MYRELISTKKLLDTNDFSATATKSFTRSDNTNSTTVLELTSGNKHKLNCQFECFSGRETYGKMYRELISTKKLLDTNYFSATAIKSFTRSDNRNSITVHEKNKLIKKLACQFECFSGSETYGKMYRELLQTKKLLDTNDFSATATKSFTRSDDRNSTTVLEIQQPPLKKKLIINNLSTQYENSCKLKSFSILMISPLSLQNHLLEVTTGIQQLSLN
ncbi:hypothetical protein [Cellulophaga sp. Z1A5H]|uniref:hypothetical protein n=1 Tax=Cellulophaga sp. Z1A5H TaxID=2687291 RepID=UPI00196B675D|nr:hypothetical protein [Cellulophaga sp. Z1A5H]